MGSKINVETKFNIVDIEVYNSILNFDGFYNKANDEAKDFYKLLEKSNDKSTFQELLNYQGKAKNIYNNKTKPKPFQSLRNINTVLCLLFSQQSGLDYTIDDVKTFLKNFELDKSSKDSDAISSFDTFIKIVRPHLSEKFQEYDYKINPKTWKFEVSKIKQQRKKGGVATTSNETNHEKEESFFSKWKYLFLIIVILGIGYLIVNGIQNYTEKQGKILEERNIIENAKMMQASRTPQLISLYEAINKELKDDYGDKGKRDLSQELIGRIVALSESLEPYLYSKNDEIIKKKLSPERGQLFLNLYKNDLDPKTFHEIISQSNFTYSDFSNKDLNGLDLTETLYGIQGHYNREVNVLISPKKRPNFSHSNFNGAKLENTILFGNFSYSNFRNIISDRVTFTWSNLDFCEFQENKLKNCLFMNSSLNHANFKNSILGIGAGHNRGFFSCDLRGVQFDNSEFSGGNDPFIFNNCFFYSRGTFFKYKINREWGPSVLLEGYPYIDGDDMFHPFNNYQILLYSNKFDAKKKIKQVTKKREVTRLIPHEAILSENIILNTNFILLNEWNYNEKDFWDLLHVYDRYHNEPIEKLSYYFVRTNDNLNRSRKVIRMFANFQGTEWESYSAKMDTLYVRSSLNKLQSEYRGIIQNHDQYIDNLKDGVASFKNCNFVYTSFTNSSMEFVSFKDAQFEKYTNSISNEFFNVKLKGNDFRIKHGTFSFSKNTIYDSLLINKKFTPLRYIKNKKQLEKINAETVGKFKNNKASYYLNISISEKDSILEWINLNERYFKLDSAKQNKGDYLLKNTSIKNIKFK